MTLPALLTDAERLAELLPAEALSLLRRRLDEALLLPEGGVVRLLVRCRGGRVQRPVEVATEGRV